VLRAVIGLEMIYMLVYMIVVSIQRGYHPGQVYKFLFRGAYVDVLQIQMLALSGIAIVYLFKLFFFKSYLNTHLWISAIMAVYVAVAIFSLGFFSLFGTHPSFNITDIRNLMRFNYNRKTKQQTIESMFEHLIEDADTETQRRMRGKLSLSGEVDTWEQNQAQTQPSLADAIFNVSNESWSENSIMGRFQRLMRDEQLYLQPGLSLQDVAQKLGTNKTYVSKLVNNTFNMGFPELLNILRVDYAEHYIMLHKDAKQSQIAEACGFFSASSFNNTFKHVTGMTPKMWMSTR
jgi:AraC-like DNA-binding protein